jgi:hypothetical protein
MDQVPFSLLIPTVVLYLFRPLWLVNLLCTIFTIYSVGIVDERISEGREGRDGDEHSSLDVLLETRIPVNKLGVHARCNYESDFFQYDIILRTISPDDIFQ